MSDYEERLLLGLVESERKLNLPEDKIKIKGKDGNMYYFHSEYIKLRAFENNLKIPKEVEEAWVIKSIQPVGITLARKWAEIVKRHFAYFTKEEYDFACNLLREQI